MVLGGATACTDFIEIDPENKVPEQGVDFTNKNNMYQPVVGAYSKVRTQGMHWCNALLMFTRDGDVWSGRTDDQGDAVAFGRKFNYNNSFWALNQVWMNFYMPASGFISHARVVTCKNYPCLGLIFPSL